MKRFEVFWKPKTHVLQIGDSQLVDAVQGEDNSRKLASRLRTSSSSSTDYFPSRYSSHTASGSDRQRNLRDKHTSRRSEGYKVGGRHRDSGSGSERKLNPLLEEFKSQKGTKYELKDVLGNLYDFSRDQHGSRFIQQKLGLPGLAQEELDAAFQEVLPQSVNLITDIFGNYVMQKFLTHGECL